MFVDVCFPKNNELEFVKIAKKLGTRGLCFVYENKKDIGNLKKDCGVVVFNAVLSTDSVVKNQINFTKYALKIHKKKQIYFFGGFEKNRKNYHAPTKNITQVHMKELKGNLFGLSLDYVLNNLSTVEEFNFVLKLCKKYRIKLFLGSFAKKPLKLRSEKELFNFFTVLGMDKITGKDSIISLQKHLVSYGSFL